MYPTFLSYVLKSTYLHRSNHHIAVGCDVMLTQNLIHFRDYVGKYCLGDVIIGGANHLSPEGSSVK